MIYLSGDDMRAVFDWPSAIEAMREVYRAPAEPGANPGRLVTATPLASMRTMPAAAPGGRYLGVKHLVKTSSGQVSYTIVLFDKETAQPTFFLDANRITARRTAATTTVALEALIPADYPVRLAVIGSGVEARNHVEAFAATRQIKSLTVYSPRPESREVFARDFHDRLPSVRAATSAHRAVEGATVVLTAARSYDETPVLARTALDPGMLVLSIGSTTPAQRELDVEVLRHADAIIADAVDEVVTQTGDMIATLKAGFDLSAKTFSLADLVGGRQTARIPPAGQGLTVYKSLGSGLQDVAMAELLALRCLRDGRGEEVDLRLEIKEV